MTTYRSGETVEYVGSIRGVHGTCTVVGRCPCDDCGNPDKVRWVLYIPGTDQVLEHVAPASIRKAECTSGHVG